MQDNHNWCDRTSWDGAVLHTITRSLWPSFLPLYERQRNTVSKAYLFCYFMEDR